MATNQSKFKLALLMMQKDEILRLDPWIRYYSALFGPSSLFIFDNGSTNQSVIDRLHEAAHNGCNVSWEYASMHYGEREEVFSGLIKDLDATNPHDFYFPLDCDEFIAVSRGGSIALGRDEIEAELAKYAESPAVLKIHHKLFHNPYRPNLYSYSVTSEKCFFAKGACDSLGPGFHHARAKQTDRELVTEIIYFEFHKQPYETHMQSCRSKLSAFMDDFSRPSLREHVRRKGHCFHSAIDLLKSEYEYAKDLLQADDLIAYPGLLFCFEELHIEYHQLFAQVFPWGDSFRLTSLRIKHLCQYASHNVAEFTYRCKASERRLARAIRQRV